jgi:membrane-associated protease RseP (regulator of RpoE activity)
MSSHIDYNLLSIVVFILVLAAVVYRDRRKFRRESVVLLRRTQRGKDFVIALGTRFPRFWKAFGTAGVVIGFAASVFMIILLFQSLFQGVERVLAGQPALPGAGIVLPSASTTPAFLPGVFLVPFWFWIISIAVLVVFHEGFHGVFAARENVRIKSLGVGLLAVIPLAFVEPDEKQLQKKPVLSQMRVFAAGSFINIIMAFFVALVVLPAIATLYTQAGVAVQPIEGYPAAAVNLSGVITGINGHEVRNVTDLNQALAGVRPGDAVTVRARVFTDGEEEAKTFSLVAVQRPPDIAGNTTGFIGITYSPAVPAFLEVKSALAAYAPAIQFVNGLFVFIFILNLGIGLFNLLPLGPLDGGRMWEILLKRVSPKKARPIMKGLTWMSILLILAVLLIQFVRL